MHNSCDILWYGRGGQGAFSAAKLLGAAYAHRGEGCFALAFPSFGPERRGAPVHAYTKLSSRPIHDRSAVLRPDYIVCLDETLAADLDADMLRAGGAFLCVNARIEELAASVLGAPIVNTALLALLCVHTGMLDEADIAYGIRETMPARIHDKNCRLVHDVFEHGATLLQDALVVGDDA